MLTTWAHTIQEGVKEAKLQQQEAEERPPGMNAAAEGQGTFWAMHMIYASISIMATWGYSVAKLLQTNKKSTVLFFL